MKFHSLLTLNSVLIETSCPGSTLPLRGIAAPARRTQSPVTEGVLVLHSKAIILSSRLLRGKAAAGCSTPKRRSYSEKQLFLTAETVVSCRITSTIDSAAFNRGTDPILQFITVNQAREIVEFRGDAELRQRIDHLSELANEGELTAEERAEYKGYVHANKFVAIFQAKARKLLGNSVS